MTKSVALLSVSVFALSSCASFRIADVRFIPPVISVAARGTQLHTTPGYYTTAKTVVPRGASVRVIGYYEYFDYAIYAADSGFIDSQDLMDPQAWAALSFPTQFTIPKEEGPAAWGRATLFVARYSPMKLQIVTDLLLETYSPTTIFEFGYQINRVPLGDSIMFVVGCDYFSGILGGPSDKAARNAHVASRYIATGNLSEDLISR